MRTKVTLAMRILLSSALFSPLSGIAALMPPQGLTEGDKFQYVFFTLASTDASSSDISVYNSFVNTAGMNGSVTSACGCTWLALVSTSSVDAIDNIDTGGLASDISFKGFYRTDGVKVADNYADLFDGSLDTGIVAAEDGVEQSFVTIFTGSGTDGRASANPLGASNVTIGSSRVNDGSWIQNTVISNSNVFSLYGVSGAQTVAATVPEIDADSFTIALGLLMSILVYCREELIAKS